jgi:hypothetical protein
VNDPVVHFDRQADLHDAPAVAQDFTAGFIQINQVGRSMELLASPIPKDGSCAIFLNC